MVDVSESHPVSNLQASKTTCKVTLKIEEAVRTSLAGQSLYVFKAVKANNIEFGVPLIWLRREKVEQIVEISWSEQIEAFLADEPIVEHSEVKTTSSAPLKIGQTFRINPDKSYEVVKDVVDEGKIKIFNNYKDACPALGVKQKDLGKGEVNGLCAFPLNSGLSIKITPVDKIIILFSNDKKVTNTVIKTAFAKGLMIDLTENNNKEVTVHYKAHNAFDYKKEDARVTEISEGQSIVEELILNE